MKILIATAQEPFAAPGCAPLARELATQLQRARHHAEVLTLPFQPQSVAGITSQMLACRLLDSGGSDLLIGLNFPAYLLPHPHKVLWIAGLYSGAYELWDHPLGTLSATPEGRQVREVILQADGNVLAEARAAFTTSAAASAHLATALGVTLPPLHHPPLGSGRLRKGKAGDYFLVPGRLAARHRPRLVMEALALTRQPVKLRFVGATDDPALERELKSYAVEAHLESRVQWLGDLPCEERCEQYARSLAIICPTVQASDSETALEAMFSSKAVVSCSDSGGALEFVVHDKTGHVTEPTAPGLAAALDELWHDRRRTQRLGEAGREHLARFDISWENVVRQLCG